MKKILFLLVATLFVAFSFSSCKKSEESPASFTVTFDANGGTIDGKAKLECTVEAGKAVEKPADPVYENHTFLGWFNGDNLWYFSDPVTQDMTLKAEWSSPVTVTVTVTFDANGGKISGKDTIMRSVTLGNTVSKPADPVWDDYHIFLGWFDEDNEQWDFNNPVLYDMKLKASWESLVSESPRELLVILYKDQLGNPMSHVFQYYYNAADKTKLDSIKVGRDTYPVEYDETNNKVYLQNLAGNWGAIFFNKDPWFNARLFTYRSGGIFSANYQENSLMTSLHLVTPEKVELDIVSDVKFDASNERYLSYLTQFSDDSVAQVEFSYPSGNIKNNLTRIFNPSFFTYAAVENAWKSTQQGIGESVLAMAVFNTPFFEQQSPEIPSSVTIKGKSRTISMDISSEIEKIPDTNLYLTTVSIELPETSYYSDVVFYCTTRGDISSRK